jgi:hypothetical protein
MGGGGVHRRRHRGGEGGAHPPQPRVADRRQVGLEGAELEES